MSEKLEFLIKQVNTEMDKFDKKRNRYRHYLMLSKIITASLTALITVLLGLTFGFTEIEIWLKNVALAITAFLIVLNTLDALYDYQSRHVSNHIAYKRLQELDFEIKFYKSEIGEGEVEPRKLKAYKTIFLDILKDDLEGWIKDRQQPIEISHQTK